jgi:hypothetical protein
MPIEVIGPENYTVAVTLDVPAGQNQPYAGSVLDAQRPSQLYLKVHSPAYYDAGVNAGRGPKASVRINGGPWVGLTDDTVECFAHEEAFGCFSGSYRTFRFTVDLAHFGSPGIQVGANVIQFRFNGTDGVTSGYRVLEMNLLSPSGTPLLSPDLFVEDDPSLWTPPRPAPEDIAEGARLWNEALLLAGPMQGAEQIRATCSACHPRDGRDLEYFNYTNYSIQERAKFHGLSQLEAEQVASYIRSLDVPAPSNARPWNPPFQPGPGMDDRPAVEWSAGAGLEWVLESDAETREYLMPNGDGSNLSPGATLNAREIPIALQLPDWHAWLPQVHPVDIWGDDFLNNSYQGYWANVHYKYTRLVYRLETEGVEALLQERILDDLVEEFSASGITYFLQGNNGQGTPLQNLPADIRKEVARRSIRNWTITKLWETHQEFDFLDVAQHPNVYGSNGEDRSWIGLRRRCSTSRPTSRPIITARSPIRPRSAGRPSPTCGTRSR